MHVRSITHSFSIDAHLDSALVQDACLAVEILAEKLDLRHLEDMTLFLMPPLLKQTNVKTVTIHEPVHECICKLLLYAPLEKPMRFIWTGVGDRANAALRLRCTEYLLLVIQRSRQIFETDAQLDSVRN